MQCSAFVSFANHLVTPLAVRYYSTELAPDMEEEEEVLLTKINPS